MKFRVLGGTHYQGNPPRKYREGDIIESDKDLVDLLPNKFERVLESASLSAVQELEVADAPLSEDEAAKEAALADEFAPRQEVPVPGFEDYVLICKPGETSGLLKLRSAGRFLRRHVMTPDEATQWLVAKGRN